jgi:predicted ATP-grasp superfamily ATP-dependent carboligase
LRNPREFLADLLRIADARKADVLIPVTEAALLVVLPSRERFRCAIPFPSARAFADICDKATVLQRAAGHGISVPAQIIVESKDDAAALESPIPFPVVLKPSRSVAGNEGSRVRAGVSYAPDAKALSAALAAMPANAYPVLLQQRINGPGFGISVLVWDGKLVAAFAHRRIREKPPSGGVSVLRESIALEPDLLSRSVALLSDFDWRGVAMVEYKLDARTGVPYLMEINGRLWGSVQLAIDAGVDFPRLLVELALDATPAPLTHYQIGVRSRWEWGDVDNLLASVLHASRVAAALPAGAAPGRLRALSDFVRAFGGGNRPEIFRSDDLGPILRETVDWFRGR